MPHLYLARSPSRALLQSWAICWKRKGFSLEPEFNIMEVDNGQQVIRSYDEREIGYDLLVTDPDQYGRRGDRALWHGR